MKPRKRKCKAPSCNNWFTPVYSTTQQACSPRCAIDIADIKRQEKEKKQHREAKNKLKTYAQKMSELQQVFNELRRYQEFLWFNEQGIEPYCISCLKPLGNDQWCCGHLKTTAARPDIRFDRNNTYLQHNIRCNKHLSGDIENYKKGLAYRFGEAKAKEILEYVETEKPLLSLTDDEISSLKSRWRKEIREIKNIL